MTYAWTLSHILSPELHFVRQSPLTMSYLVQLVKQLTQKQALYAEIRWRDPIDECSPIEVPNA